jgi:hypothetical protein
MNIDKLSEDLQYVQHYHPLPSKKEGKTLTQQSENVDNNTYLHYAILRIWELSGEDDILPLFLY